MKLKILFSSLLLLAACGDDGHHDDDQALPSCEEDLRDEIYVAGIAKTGAASYQVTLLDANPAPPRKGDNTWTIAVTDPGGNPVTGLHLDVEGYMPDHGHGTLGLPPVVADGDESYVVGPFNLFMPGFWEVSVQAVDTGATEAVEDDIDLDRVTFNFCIEG